MFWLMCGTGLGIYFSATTEISSVETIWIVFAAIIIIKLIDLLDGGNKTRISSNYILILLFFFAVLSGSNRLSILLTQPTGSLGMSQAKHSAFPGQFTLSTSGIRMGKFDIR